MANTHLKRMINSPIEKQRAKQTLSSQVVIKPPLGVTPENNPLIWTCSQMIKLRYHNSQSNSQEQTKDQAAPQQQEGPKTSSTDSSNNQPSEQHS